MRNRLINLSQPGALFDGGFCNAAGQISYPTDTAFNIGHGVTGLLYLLAAVINQRNGIFNQHFDLFGSNG